MAPESHANETLPRITVGFNFVIFGAWLFFELLTKAIKFFQLYQTYEATKGIEGMADILATGIAAAFGSMVISLLVAGVLYYLLKEIWKRFIVDIFSVRMITRSEACALVLISLFF